MPRDPSTRDQLLAILVIAFAVFLAGLFLATGSPQDEQARDPRVADSLGYQIPPDSLPVGRWGEAVQP